MRGESLSSPEFVGRHPELALLRETLGRLLNAPLGTHEVVLVSGEVGIGKSRLIKEFLARAAGDGGGAGDRRYPSGLPEIHWNPDLARLKNALDATEGLGARESAALIAIFDQLETQPAQLASAIGHLLRPRRTRRLVILGFRSTGQLRDDVRRLVHRLILSEEGRQLRVVPLSEIETSEIAHSVLGRHPSSAERAWISSLSEGVPRIAIELAAGVKDMPAVPERLVDYADAVVRSVSDSAPMICRALSTARYGLTASMLAHLTSSSRIETDDAIQRMVDWGIVVGDGQSPRWRFSRQILASCASDPRVFAGQTNLRARLVGALASSLSYDPLDSVEMGYQHEALGDVRSAMHAYIAACRNGYQMKESRLDRSEAVDALHRIARVVAAGMPGPLVEPTLEACQTLAFVGRPDLALEVAKRAMMTCDPNAPSAPRLYRLAARYATAVGRPAEAEAAIAHSLALPSTFKPEDGARAQATSSAYYLVTGQLRSAISAAAEMRVDPLPDRDDAYIQTMAFSGNASCGMGLITAGIESLETAARLSHHLTSGPTTQAEVVNNLSFALARIDRLADAASAIASVGDAVGAIDAGASVDVLATSAHIDIQRGDYPPAARAIDRARRLCGTNDGRTLLDSLALRLDAIRGQQTPNLLGLRSTALASPRPDVWGSFGLAIADAAYWGALDAESALSALGSCLNRLSARDDRLWELELHTAISRLAADQSERARIVGDRQRVAEAIKTADDSARAVRDIVADIDPCGLGMRAAAISAAEFARATHQGRGDAYRQCARTMRGSDVLLDRLYVDYRCLEGETRPALSAIDQLGAKARSIGARPLAALVATIRRARTLHDVVPPIEDRGASGGLTGREVEVLRFLADGLSDRQIAERLGISKRTVSTHVSHILAKLSVGKRAEAALLARHLPENGDPRHARMS